MSQRFKVGDRVLFGRSQGEKTLGEVVKLNRTKAKVRTLEARGSQKDHPVGSEWAVPYSMLQLAPEERAPRKKVSQEVAQNRNVSAKVASFSKGDSVWFVGKNQQKISATVVRVNKKTVTVQDGASMWRVPPTMLNHASREVETATGVPVDKVDTTPQPLTFLPVPEDTPWYRREEIERLRSDMTNPDKSTWKNGVLYWKVSDGTERCLSPNMQFKDALVVPPPAQAAAYDQEFKYRAAQGNRTQEQIDEQRFEARAAFGPGVEVVNILTGERYTT